jgi:hypothetical protein
MADKRSDSVAQSARLRRSSPTDDADRDKTPWPTFALLLVRFRAVLLANYWFGQGGTLKQAESRMAEALAVSREAIRQWTQTALPEAFGKNLVRKRIEEARAAGWLTVGQGIEDYLIKYAGSEASVRDFTRRHEQVNLGDLRRRHNVAQTAKGDA